MLHHPAPVLALTLLIAAPPLLRAGDSASPAPGAASSGESMPLRFDVDVIAAIDRAGCNMGACHGNQNGKGGFRLSLRGEYPQEDYEAIVHQYASRRIDPFAPAESLLLQKATANLAHQGGQRVEVGDEAYQAIHDWIAAGAPAPPGKTPQVTDLVIETESTLLAPDQNRIEVRVIAHFDTGQVRDVTSTAVYEPLDNRLESDGHGQIERRGDGVGTMVIRYLGVSRSLRLTLQPDRPQYAAKAVNGTYRNRVDPAIEEQLQQLRIDPAQPSDDTTFLRRIHLDLTGSIPDADTARRFAADNRVDKRARMVESLLASPEYADYWSYKWSDLLRCDERVLDEKGVAIYRGWMRDAVAQGMPLDRFVAALIEGQGSTYENPAANFYRANRTVPERAEAVARLFLGVRLQCAQCHNHPSDRWTQDDYYGWSAAFAGIDYEIKSNEPRDKLDKNEFRGEQLVQWVEGKEVKHPRSGQVMAPRALGADSAIDDPKQPLSVLAEWLTAAENRQFARTLTNWIWSQMMGRGLVEPYDDFRVTNPPTHPELLEMLTDHLIDSGFDTRALIRLIATSRVYGQDYRPADPDFTEAAYYSHTELRRLKAEQLLDAQTAVLDVPVKFNEAPRGTRAVQLDAPRLIRGSQQFTDGEGFLRVFGQPTRQLACDCERSDETSLAQAFLLIGGQSLQDRIADDAGRVAREATADQSPQEMIDSLYWAALGRPPGDEQRQQLVEHLESSDDRRRALEDLAWALLNGKEFLFRY